jgi:hypothetical protein
MSEGWKSMNYYRTNTIDTIVGGERWMSKDTSNRLSPRRDEIARLAYYFYEARGRRDGSDLDDWLLAEAELNRRRG